MDFSVKSISWLLLPEQNLHGCTLKNVFSSFFQPGCVHTGELLSKCLMDKDWKGHEIFIAYFFKPLVLLCLPSQIYSNCHPDVFVHPNLHPSYYFQVPYLSVMTKRGQGASQETVTCWGTSGKAVSAHLEDVVTAYPVASSPFTSSDVDS